MSATVARERPAARDRPGAIPDPAVVGEQWSALQGRLDALLEERGRSPQDDRTDPFRASWSHVLKYLPLALLVTFAVVVVPVALVNSVLPRHGWLWSVIAVLAAVGCSLAIASVIAWAWKRCRWSQEVIFADLMIWGLVRHLLVARRLTRARRVFEAADRAGRPLSIEQLVTLTELVQALDPYVDGHSRRVAANARMIARELGLGAEELAKVESAALLHDVGKVYTPREILNKPEQLTDREYAIIKLHAADGAAMVAAAGEPEIATIVRHHHERLDGGGYPERLAGDQIPLGSRIIAVADTFDALTSTRLYRRRCKHKEALATLSAEAGKQLDATVVAAFAVCYEARAPVTGSAVAGALPARIIDALSSQPGISASSVAHALPAIGAAGVLAAAPGLSHHGPAARAAHGAVATHSISKHIAPVAATHARSVSAPPHRSAGRHQSPRASVGPSAPRRRAGGHPRLRVVVPRATQPASSPPAARAPSHSETTGSSGPNHPVIPPTGVPTPPSPPVETHVEGPSLPPVHVPIPSVPTPPVSTPVGEVPSVHTPGGEVRVGG